MTDELAVTKFGKVVLHKAKRNNNLSFSKGKTWQLEDMRGLEVISVSRSIFHTKRTVLTDGAAIGVRLDHDYSTISVDDREGQRSAALPEFSRQGLPHIHQDRRT